MVYLDTFLTTTMFYSVQMTLQRLKLALASVPPIWVFFLILESRVSLFIQFDEWFLPQV